MHASTSTPEPGLVRHNVGQRLIVGEPLGEAAGRSARVVAVAELLTHAGFEVTHSDNVRYDVWYKLWGNMTMNPVSAITGATIDRVLADPLVRAFCSAAMQEAAAIGARIGCPIAQSPEDRHAITARLGAFKTSMLQDVEAGKPVELDALVGAVRELGVRTGVPTPWTDALLGLQYQYRGTWTDFGAPARVHRNGSWRLSYPLTKAGDVDLWLRVVAHRDGIRRPSISQSFVVPVHTRRR